MKLRSIICLLLVFLDVAPVIKGCEKKDYYVIFDAEKIGETVVYDTKDTNTLEIIEIDKDSNQISIPESMILSYYDDKTGKTYVVDYWSTSPNGENPITFPYTVDLEDCREYFEGRHYSHILYAHWVVQDAS